MDKYQCACNFKLIDANYKSEEPIYYHSYIPCSENKVFKIEDADKALHKVKKQYIKDVHEGREDYPYSGISHEFLGLGDVKKVIEK